MPKIQPPGTSMFPVTPGKSATARTVWMQLGVCSMAQPHSTVAGRHVREEARSLANPLGRNPRNRLGPLRRVRLDTSGQILEARGPLGDELGIV